MPNLYDLGDQIRLRGTFSDDDDVATDPTAVFVAVDSPSTSTLYQYGVDDELIKAETGIYYVDINLDEAGEWSYRFYSTGTGKAAGKERLLVGREYATTDNRAGMVRLVQRWRRLVNDTAGSAWTEAEVIELLDRYRLDVWEEELTPNPLDTSGTTSWNVYLSRYEDIEGTASGTAAFRLYDTGGTVITSGFTLNEQRGIITFTADQDGSARYVDCRSYDLHAAAADGWREAMAGKADKYDFQADGGRYSRSQWFAMCERMAQYHDKLSRPFVVTMNRSDFA